jgi:hypothetical protein
MSTRATDDPFDPRNSDPSERETRRLASSGGRRDYGAAPMGFVVTVALVGPVVALWLVVTGHALDGVVVALVAFTLAALFAAEAREALLHGPVTRAAGTAAARSSERAAYAGSAANAWSRAAAEVGRQRARRWRLERRLPRLMRELGEATYAGDYSSAQLARARASAARTQIAHTERASAHAVCGARERLAERR